MTSARDPRDLARELLERARREPLPNVRASYESAAGRWNAIADREEEIDLERVRKAERLRAARLARVSAASL